MADEKRSYTKALLIDFVREANEVRAVRSRRVRYQGELADVSDEEVSARAFSYEVRDANGRVLYRGTRFDPTGAVGEYLSDGSPERPEAADSPPQFVQAPSLEEVTTFQLIVPDLPEASSVAIYSLAMEEVYGAPRPAFKDEMPVPERPTGSARQQSREEKGD